MRVLIIENEIYLAQSIASKLENLGYGCEIARSAAEAIKSEPAERIKEGDKDAHFDVVLLSSAFAGDDTQKIIHKFKDSVVILLITYISNDTVSIPIKAGASDYIQKPFMIEELVRKIKHFEEFRRLQTFIKTYQDYLNYHFKAVSALNFDFKRIKLPLLIKCNKMINADNFVFEYAKALNLSFKYVPLEPGTDVSAIAAANPHTLLYFSNFQILRQEAKNQIVELAAKRKLIVSSTNQNEETSLETLNIASDEKNFQIDEILTIDDYIKHIIVNYQDKYPDTELSKKLGISRKSLWEKRKKYDVVKKK
ncbi:response regulator receiver domain protein [Campylobacter rectus RM3267]|uniref:Receiver domain protein n=2 Tax=Campylobacter rectus TaxID=203 RepID=A0A6G5QL75_CAMRE|nr:response regulator [Campylobacter rectus]EEF14550.1 response regulator receiver domain protein [Campylobacter rectus RM3267]QCD46337.1 receiver domain protein [Campylobacter rectus]UEB47038.1 response regulator [Campylobacter rectus]